jgi:hypothetical protein
MQISSRVALELLLAIGPFRGSWSIKTAENSDRTVLATRCSFVRRTGAGPGFPPRTRPRQLIISWKNSKNSGKCHASSDTAHWIRGRSLLSLETRIQRATRPVPAALDARLRGCNPLGVDEHGRDFAVSLSRHPGAGRDLCFRKYLNLSVFLRPHLFGKRHAGCDMGPGLRRDGVGSSEGMIRANKGYSRFRGHDSKARGCRA